ncbi:hypothetical protein RAN53_04245 [Halomonas sp. SSL-5]|uniref:hypothetical protein n=1 Tax=Halomonas sp. SSL-5 TaxID=3065855 RepID=UPI0027388590|nr:hypothetical protein [Halomonas sp. SSL-5]MDY7115546.1 hypothetical protein [Halomonas sp. SSL-5]
MSHLAQTTSDQRQGSTTLARLATLDLGEDDIVRPELRDDAILADRARRVVHPRPGRLDSPRRAWRTDPITTTAGPHERA